MIPGGKQVGFERFEFSVDEEKLDDMYIRAVQDEYTKIDESWLQLHYKTSVILVIFSLLVEIAMGMILVNSDMLTTTVYRYYLKFLIIPSGINFILITIETLIMRSKRFSQNHKIYSVSLIYVGIGFVLFSVHCTFTAAYYIFAIAIMLTAIYADYRVTCVTALASISSIIISELFLEWDKDKISVFENTHRMGDFLISLFVLLAFSIAIMAVIRFERRKNSAGIQKEIERQLLQQSVHMDEMTGVYNRKAFRAEMKYVEDTASDRNYTLAIVDIDKFKDVNDTWGHHVGDRCLIEFAKILKEFCLDMTPFRYGGDEFCLLFCDKSMEEAEAICGEIKTRVNLLCFEDYPTLILTASFGIASISDQVDTVRLFIHADRALYEAKKVRNAIRTF
jgi:diguanylate cyclase (GGDEF)-like protein